MTTSIISVADAPTDQRTIDGHVVHALRHPDVDLFMGTCTCTWTADSFSTARTARGLMAEHAAVHQEPGAVTADQLQVGDWFSVIDRCRPHAMHVAARSIDRCGKVHLVLTDRAEIVIKPTQPVRMLTVQQLQHRRPCHCCGARGEQDCQPWCPQSPLFHWGAPAR